MGNSVPYSSTGTRLPVLESATPVGELHLSDLVDLITLSRLLNDFCQAVGVAAAIIDLQGTVLVSAQWQRICTDFHRVNPDTCARCIESDTELALQVQRGANFSMYQCRNGMTDAASPIIIEGQHLANVFVGQFLLEVPDIAFFTRQAGLAGFDREAYLGALAEVPQIAPDKLNAILGFLSGFAQTVATLGAQALRMKQMIAQRTIEALDSQNRWRATREALPDLLFELNPNGVFEDVHTPVGWMSTTSTDGLLGKPLSALFPAEAVAQIRCALDVARQHGSAQGAAFVMPLADGNHWFELSVACKPAGPGQEANFIAIARDITARKQTEDALQENREKYRALSEAAFESIFISENGRCLEQNHRAEQMFGYTAEEALDKMGTDWIALEDRERVMANLVSGYGQPYEVTGLRKDGSTFPAVIRGTMVHYKGRQVRVTSISDITERRQAEDTLRHSEERFSKAFHASPLAASIARASDGLFIDANRNYERDFGLKREDLIGRTSVEIGLWPSAEIRDPWAASLARDDRVVGWETTWLHKNGEIRHVSLSAETVDISGESCILAFAMDITERKLSEQNLRVAATTFESQEGVMVTDCNRVILRVNTAFTEVTGYSAEEAVGQTPKMLDSGRHDKGFFTTMWESIDRTGSWSGEIWNRRKNGEIYPQAQTITAVKGEDHAVTHYVGTFTDITQRMQAVEEIRNLAFFDPLTGLPNRRLLRDRLTQSLAVNKRGQHRSALMFIDLDNFKVLNDTQGHDVGDQLLTRVAARLSAAVRGADTVARLGGDEFVILLQELNAEESDASQVEAVASKILFTVRQPVHLTGTSPPESSGSSEYRCTASIGITLFADDTLSVDEVLRQADLAMYQAKAAGRNTVRFFDPKMQASVTARAALEAGLRRALQEGHLLLHYQGQVDSESRLTGVEALVRWQPPGQALISPAEFIAVAEETGLILELGQWVLASACQQLAAWAKNPAMAHLTIAVNVSPKQFRQASFVDDVLASIGQFGTRAHQLKLELTESLLLDDVEDIIDKMTILRTHGIGCSLDDFGTGYSSLSYLKRLPLAQLKIDQSFVRDVLSDNSDAAIARTIIVLAQTLGLSVIAEGVETQAQRDFLHRAGCQAYQGFYFWRPLAVDAFEQRVLQLRSQIPV